MWTLGTSRDCGERRVTGCFHSAPQATTGFRQPANRICATHRLRGIPIGRQPKSVAPHSVQGGEESVKTKGWTSETPYGSRHFHIRVENRIQKLVSVRLTGKIGSRINIRPEILSIKKVIVLSDFSMIRIIRIRPLLPGRNSVYTSIHCRSVALQPERRPTACSSPRADRRSRVADQPTSSVGVRWGTEEKLFVVPPRNWPLSSRHGPGQPIS